MKRLIIVTKKFEPELRAAARAAAAVAGVDAYAYIKAYLQQLRVPHDDRHMDPRHLNDAHSYYHA